MFDNFNTYNQIIFPREWLSDGTNPTIRTEFRMYMPDSILRNINPISLYLSST